MTLNTCKANVQSTDASQSYIDVNFFDGISIRQIFSRTFFFNHSSIISYFSRQTSYTGCASLHHDCKFCDACLTSGARDIYQVLQFLLQNIRFDRGTEGSSETNQPYYSVERQISPLGSCHNESSTPGSSKIDHESATALTTMPVGSKLSSLMLSMDDCQFVDAFVALSLSNDGESIEVKHILQKVSREFKSLFETFLFSALLPRRCSSVGRTTFEGPSLVQLY